jgi:acyl carrier protein
MLFLLQSEAGIIPRGVPPPPDPGGETGSGAHSPAIERVNRKRGVSMASRHGAALRHATAAFAVLFCLQPFTAENWMFVMPELSPPERELADLLVESLNLDGVAAAEIDPEAPLFGAGLGLDSIDALELSLAISKKYGFQLRSDNDDNRRIFGSLRALSAHVEQHRTV